MSVSQNIFYTELFLLEDPFAKKILRLTALQDWAVEKAWPLFKGEWLPPEPVIFKPFRGTSPADFLWSGPLVCISQKVMDLLSANWCTGWSIFPAVVHDGTGGILPGYSGLVVKSSVGKRDVTRSPVLTLPPIVHGGRPPIVYKGMYFDESRWDGSDIFRIEAGHIVITKPLREIFKKNKITNIMLTPLSEVEINKRDADEDIEE